MGVIDKKSKKYTETFINKYIAPALAHLAYGNIIDNKKMEIFATPDVETAYVTYNENKGKFLIFIGTQMEAFDNVRFDRDIEEMTLLLLKHECAHVLFTEMKGGLMWEKIEEAGIPFSFINLAEDVRINYNIVKYYESETGVNQKLNIVKFSGSYVEEKSDMSPETILYQIGVLENSRPVGGLLYGEVMEFYHRFIRAKDVFEVIDIAVDWKEHFHKDGLSRENKEDLFSGPLYSGDGDDGSGDGDGDKKKESSGSPSPKGSPKDSSEDPAGDKMQESMDDLGKELCSDTADSEDEAGGPSEKTPQEDFDTQSLNDLGESGDELDLEELLKNSVSATSPQPRESSVPCKIDRTDAVDLKTEASNCEHIFSKDRPASEFNERQMTEEILPELRKIKAESKSKNTATKKPTKKFNRKKLPMSPITLNTKLYKKKEISPQKIGKKDITFLCDLSGSMSGQPKRDMLTLLISLNRLSQMYRELNLTVVGTKITHEPFYQGVSLPCDEKVLLSLTTNGGGEGLGYALKDMVKKTLGVEYRIEKQDTLVFITDGNLTGEDTRELNHALSTRELAEIKTIGVHVGTHGVNPHMKEWFNDFIADDSLLNVVKEIVEMINTKNAPIRKKGTEQNIVSSSPKR